jgi:hypothetical protein
MNVEVCREDEKICIPHKGKRGSLLDFFPDTSGWGDKEIVE